MRSHLLGNLVTAGLAARVPRGGWQADFVGTQVGRDPLPVNLIDGASRRRPRPRSSAGDRCLDRARYAADKAMDAFVKPLEAKKPDAAKVQAGYDLFMAKLDLAAKTDAAPKR